LYKFTQNPDTFNHFKEHKLLTTNMLIIVKDQLVKVVQLLNVLEALDGQSI
jgi:hypothetical protein